MNILTRGISNRTRNCPWSSRDLCILVTTTSILLSSQRNVTERDEFRSKLIPIYPVFPQKIKSTIIPNWKLLTELWRYKQTTINTGSIQANVRWKESLDEHFVNYSIALEVFLKLLNFQDFQTKLSFSLNISIQSVFNRMNIIVLWHFYNLRWFVMNLF